MRIGLLLERYGKRAFFGAFAGGGRGAAGAVPSCEDMASVRRVLLVRPNFRLGNLVLATPVITALHRSVPGVEVDVLCGASYAELFAHDPAVCSTIGVPRLLHRHPVDLARLVRRLRSRRYDLVIDAARGSSFLGAFFARLSGGRFRVASATCRYRALFNVHVPSNPGSWHKSDILLDLLRGLGLDVTDAEPYVALGAGDHREAGEVWRSLGLDPGRPVIGVVLGARGPKQWPLERIVEVARGLHDAGRAQVLLLTGPEDRDRIGTIVHELGATIAVAPLVPIRVFAALLARCRAAITPDSGPMHLAAAVGTPLVAMLRTEQSTYYAPRASRHRVLREDRGASTASVLAAVESILDDPPPRS